LVDDQHSLQAVALTKNPTANIRLSVSAGSERARNLPQQAPHAFADAVIAADRL
jgi:hypothetical protein